MGCDIHMFVERRDRYGAEWEHVSDLDFEDRYYMLFAALAGVRNDKGIAPMSMPRGLPDDISDSVSFAHQGSGAWFDTHGHSHFTLREIALWEGWQQERTETVYARRRGGGRPISDSQLDSVIHMFNEMGTYVTVNGIEFASKPSSDDSWRRFEYTMRLRANVGHPWWLFVVDLHRLGISFGSDNVRIVFWFDN